MTPTGRTLKLLRSWGHVADVVERWIPKLDRRRDLFGGFDVIGIDPREKQTWLVQCTTAPNLAARVRKLQGLPAVPKLLTAGIHCECWGWEKRDEHWTVRRIALQAANCEPLELTPRRKRGRRPVQAGLFDG